MVLAVAGARRPFEIYFRITLKFCFKMWKILEFYYFIKMETLNHSFENYRQIATIYLYAFVCSIDSRSGSIKGSGPGSPAYPQSPHSPASPMEMHAPYQRRTSLHAVQSAVSSALQSLVAGGNCKRKIMRRMQEENHAAMCDHLN